ncbi:unnamed protein product [Acanthoscelides obtectus]|uniref:Double jelly roll-like domain-containing protein n=1 Tax=Acanthoscelides obtectus TaxID=200917 RepID=A0A9P0LPF2_ACAOB|nr:unnamed protein product [Acanthoscelides obtectus]CAK1651369.1 hypothetical protein AOBTE_LOCUS17227 [Acanthoscelides obtectus]
MEYHTHQPYINANFDCNDEIRIAIQELDTFTLPSQSYLYLEGTTLTKADGSPAENFKFVNTAFSFLFQEIRYELNGVVVDSVRNVGLTSTLKGYLSYNQNESTKLQNAGWYPKESHFLVTDVQGFKIEHNKYIVKELAGYDGQQICHYVFKPPFALDLLPPDLQEQVGGSSPRFSSVGTSGAGFLGPYLRNPFRRTGVVSMGVLDPVGW